MTKKIAFFIVGLVIVIILAVFLLTDKFGLFRKDYKQEWKSCNDDQECSLVSIPGCCSCSDGDAINSKFINEYNEYRRSNTGSCWGAVCSICPQSFKTASCVENRCITAIEDQTANWQTYRNEKINGFGIKGFEFKHPGSWQLSKEDNNAASFKDTKTGNAGNDYLVFSISYLPNQGGLALNEWWAEYSKNTPYKKEIQLSIADFNAYKLVAAETEAGPRYVFVTGSRSEGGFIIDISTTGLRQDVINQILSTFKFTQ